MKIVVLTLAALLLTPFASSTSAAQTLVNCFSGKKAQHFASRLEDISQSGQSPLLLLNEAQEVVGVLAAEPERAEKYPHAAWSVGVASIYLCGSFEVSDFHYLDTEDENLMNWISPEGRSVEMTQDEGMIVLSAKPESQIQLANANLIRVDFKLYDVFSDEETIEREKNLPDFLMDWGVPKARGVFYFYTPGNWSFKK